MRPSLTLIIIVLAVLFSLAAGLVLGGGPGAWFGSNAPANGSPNEGIPVAPPTTTPAPSEPVSQLVATVALNAPIPVTTTPTTTATVPPRATTAPTNTPAPTPTVAPTETPVPNEASETVTGAQLIANTAVRLRAAPANDSTIIGRLNGGQSATVLGRTEDWAWAFVVLDSNTIQGWVTADAEFVTLEGDIDSVSVVE